MRTSQVRILTAAFAALVIAGCAKPPAAELEAARASMDAAKTAQADLYAPDSWAAVVDADQKLQAEQAAVERKYAIIRSYDQTRRLAAEVKEASDRAATAAVEGKKRARDEATALMTEATAKADEARTSLAKAPRGKDTQADLASLKSDVEGLDGALRDMQAAFDAGDFLGAKAKAQAIIDAAESVRSEVERARQSARSS